MISLSIAVGLRLLKMNSTPVIESVRRTISLQASAIQGLSDFIGEDLIRAVDLIAHAKGRLVISGIGKSAIVAQKIVATMNSTGTPALFMHAADAIHGDLGMVQEGDVVMVISKSGDSPEIKVLAPLVKNFGNTLIGMVGNMQSYLARNSDLVINTTVAQEACPNNLAPTTSTTAQMVMGDALAICLMEAKGFKTDDFARYHPGGALGKQLYLRVGDMVEAHERPFVREDTPIREVLVEITAKRLGAAAVLDEQGKLTGIITDGDVRRMMEKYEQFTNLFARDIMGKNPRHINSDALAIEALGMMREANINQLVTIKDGQYAGILHLQDLVREGII